MENDITNYQNEQENIPDTRRELNQNDQKSPSKDSKEEIKEDTRIKSGLNPININKLSQNSFQNLNIKIINFFQLLGGYNKLLIICHKTKCSFGYRPVRSFKVFGINSDGEDNLIMTASQEELYSNSYGYMLVYKSNNFILGTLGYQFNHKNNCNCFKCCNDISLKKFFGSCKNCQCCCNECDQNGGCCVGGCCTEQGCFCCCEDGCCIGGCCNFCSCCCFDGGCCKEPCCKDGCCPFPNYEKILLDVRLLNTMKEALNKDAGLYVTTLYAPIDYCGIILTDIGYKKCGERFALNCKCCPCNDAQLGITDLEKKKNVGLVKQEKICSFDVKSYEVNLPKYALPLEKLLIISEIFMFVYLHWDESTKDKLIVTRKKNVLPGLEPNFC